MSDRSIPWSARVAAVGEGWLPYAALGSAALLFLLAAEWPMRDDDAAERPVPAALTLRVSSEPVSGPQAAASAAIAGQGR